MKTPATDNFKTMKLNMAAALTPSDEWRAEYQMHLLRFLPEARGNGSTKPG